MVCNVGQIGATGSDRTEERRERADMKERSTAPGDIVSAVSEAAVGAFNRAARQRFVGQHATLGVCRCARSVNDDRSIAYSRMPSGVIDMLVRD